MVTKYIDRKGKEISEEQWKSHKQDKSYATFAEFKNDKVSLLINWDGRIEGAENLFRSSYPVFRTVQMDYIPESGKWVESFDSEKTFSNEKKAREFYDDFLLRWTDSYIDFDTAEMVEVGNKAAPPPPPKPKSKDEPTGNYGDAW